MSLVCVGTSNAFGSGASITVPAVAGQQSGDLALLLTTGDTSSNNAMAAPTGWATIDGGSTGFMFWKAVASGDASGWSVPTNQGVVVVYRGLAATPFYSSPYAKGWSGAGFTPAGNVAPRTFSEGGIANAPSGARVAHMWIVTRSGLLASSVSLSPVGTERLRHADGGGWQEVNDMAVASAGVQAAETATPPSDGLSANFWNGWAVVQPARSELGMVI